MAEVWHSSHGSSDEQLASTSASCGGASCGGRTVGDGTAPLCLPIHSTAQRCPFGWPRCQQPSSLFLFTALRLLTALKRLSSSQRNAFSRCALFSGFYMSCLFTGPLLSQAQGGFLLNAPSLSSHSESWPNTKLEPSHWKWSEVGLHGRKQMFHIRWHETGGGRRARSSNALEPSTTWLDSRAVEYDQKSYEDICHIFQYWPSGCWCFICLQALVTLDNKNTLWCLQWELV